MSKNVVTLKSGSKVTQVMGTDTDRSVTYDFLLKFHNYGLISHRFRDRRRFQSKIANFHTFVYFAPRWRGFSWNWYRRKESQN